jgi:trehalose 6-phosphate synthase/phosphatase
LDYDGTLVPIAQTPELATPQPALLSLLASLSARAGAQVHLVSGRSSDVLTDWFGHLPVHLWAEHGAYYRSPDSRRWEPTVEIHIEWMPEVRRVLEEITTTTPGSFIEQKHASIAWHYRGADPESGPRQAQALRLKLTETLQGRAFDILDGRKVIEVRILGVSKAIVVERLRAELSRDPAILAVGDDWTDEDLFEALPASSVTVAVGRRKSCAKYQLPDHNAVREMLEEFVK